MKFQESYRHFINRRTIIVTIVNGNIGCFQLWWQYYRRTLVVDLWVALLTLPRHDSDHKNMSEHVTRSVFQDSYNPWKKRIFFRNDETKPLDCSELNENLFSVSSLMSRYGLKKNSSKNIEIFWSKKFSENFSKNIFRVFFLKIWKSWKKYVLENFQIFKKSRKNIFSKNILSIKKFHFFRWFFL